MVGRFVIPDSGQYKLFWRSQIRVNWSRDVKEPIR